METEVMNNLSFSLCKDEAESFKSECFSPKQEKTTGKTLVNIVLRYFLGAKVLDILFWPVASHNSATTKGCRGRPI